MLVFRTVMCSSDIAVPILAMTGFSPDESDLITSINPSNKMASSFFVYTF